MLGSIEAWLHSKEAKYNLYIKAWDGQEEYIRMCLPADTEEEAQEIVDKHLGIWLINSRNDTQEKVTSITWHFNYIRNNGLVQAFNSPKEKPRPLPLHYLPWVGIVTTYSAGSIPPQDLSSVEDQVKFLSENIEAASRYDSRWLPRGGGVQDVNEFLVKLGYPHLSLEEIS